MSVPQTDLTLSCKSRRDGGLSRTATKGVAYGYILWTVSKVEGIYLI